ncbi:hypothetical protein GQ43DRAFT_235969 [Delitschia confertaspora ATCC 74209]|uniref:Uncharacterized protein n=1 Tax=Delitschia confertaspora ATCC 74209 TaxID=1513339 RepID=A0A9P4JSY5_9PLEO|nr:hypothetical protein GQ43DRAFT_235969 [Delitschia confertaspora ATCC 74209]
MSGFPFSAHVTAGTGVWRSDDVFSIIPSSCPQKLRPHFSKKKNRAFLPYPKQQQDIVPSLEDPWNSQPSLRPDWRDFHNVKLSREVPENREASLKNHPRYDLKNGHTYYPS